MISNFYSETIAKQSRFTPKKAFLTGMRIDGECMPALVETLKTNTTLTHLFLGLNYIDCKGAIALAEVLKTNTTLRVLNFWYNNIRDEGANALFKMLQVNVNITDLFLGHNDIEKSIFTKIDEQLETNVQRRKNAFEKFNQYQALLIMAHASKEPGAVPVVPSINLIMLRYLLQNFPTQAKPDNVVLKPIENGNRINLEASARSRKKPCCIL